MKQALDISRRRMNQIQLDMVQFHWWDYSDKRYLQLLQSATVLAEPLSSDGSVPSDIVGNMFFFLNHTNE